MEDKTKHYPDDIYFITICEEKGKMIKSMNKPLHPASHLIPLCAPTSLQDFEFTPS